MVQAQAGTVGGEDMSIAMFWVAGWLFTCGLVLDPKDKLLFIACVVLWPLLLGDYVSDKLDKE